ncbi:MAG: transporter substrate-binding domain-containing protein [Oceanospirillaceae bacterium]|nr:transporter substrate-binding domain-containing protein [Oceanospirillaceae bacterium]
MKKMLATAALTAVTLVSGAAQAGDIVRIATEGAYPPWNALNSAGTLEGFEIDLYKDLCLRAKLECTMEQTPWEGIIPSLKAGKFDVIMAGMSITDKRKKKITFTRSYAASPAVFVVDKKSALASFTVGAAKISLANLDEAEQKALDATIAALKGKTIGVQKGTIHLNFLKEYLKSDITIRTYATQEQLDLDLQSGRVDVAFAAMSYWHPLFQKEEGKDFLAIGPGFSEGPFGAGVGLGLRKDDQALADKFSVAINAAIADGTVSKIAMKWFGFDASTK